MIASNYFLGASLTQLLKLAHLVKVHCDLVEAFKSELFIQLFQERNVGLEVLVVVSDIDKSTEDLRREYKFKGLAILLDGVEDAKHA